MPVTGGSPDPGSESRMVKSRRLVNATQGGAAHLTLEASGRRRRLWLRLSFARSLLRQRLLLCLRVGLKRCKTPKTPPASPAIATLTCGRGKHRGAVTPGAPDALPPPKLGAAVWCSRAAALLHELFPPLSGVMHDPVDALYPPPEGGCQTHGVCSPMWTRGLYPAPRGTCAGTASAAQCNPRSPACSSPKAGRRH